MTTIPIGDCFRYATMHAITLPGDDAAIVHGIVANPWPGAGERSHYWHAWIEYRGKVLDWQTEYAGRPAMNVADFYALFKPEQMARYSPKEAVQNMLQAKHHGPWHI